MDRWLRVAWAASALVACCVPVAASAAIPVAIYPPLGAGVSAETLDDVQSLVESALRDGERRGVLAPATPAVLARSCPEPVQDACLARLAGNGRVLHVRVKPAATVLVVALALVDASGARTRWVGFGVDPNIMASGPARQAMADLEVLAESRAPAPSVAAAPAAPTPGVAAAAAPGVAVAPTPGAAAPAAPPAASAATASPLASEPNLRVSSSPANRVLRLKAPAPPPPTPWQATAGKWTVVGGLGLLVAGGAVALLDKQLADDLTAKSQSHGLRASDRSSYDQVQTYNAASTFLFVAGGVAVGTGLVLWAVAPDPVEARGRKYPTLGVQGRY